MKVCTFYHTSVAVKTHLYCGILDTKSWSGITRRNSVDNATLMPMSKWELPSCGAGA